MWYILFRHLRMSLLPFLLSPQTKPVKMASTIHIFINNLFFSVSQCYPGYGASAAVCKRWLRCMMVGREEIEDLLVDVLVAYLFINPHPFRPPSSPLTAFLRFLTLLSSTHWHLSPIIVNFNNILTRKYTLYVSCPIYLCLL